MTPPASGGGGAKHRPTPQQEAIYEAVANGTGHLVVSALAGTGKTTTAIGALAASTPGIRTGFIAFNAHIAKELSSRLSQVSSSAYAATLHSLGFAACRKALPGVEVDEAKLTKLAKQEAPDLYPSERQAAEQLCRLGKYALWPRPEDRTMDWTALADHYGVELPDQREKIDRVYALATNLLILSAERTRTIDFDDMVYLPVVRGWNVQQFDLLLVDEAQDLSLVQQRLAREATASGRLCPIGDKHQAIYGFSGADCEALPRLAGELEASLRGAAVLPLSVTFRCPTSHVALAQRIVPEIEAAPGAVEGSVQTASLKEIARAVEPGGLIICRKNAPVVGLTYKLVLAGVKAVMRGRDIGKGLTSLIARLKPDSPAGLVDKLEDWRQKEERRLERRSAPPSAFQALEDRCECLGQLAGQVDSLDALDRFIRETFSDTEKPGAAVVLSSVHRSKGLEAERVFVLDPQSLPLSHPDQKGWERQQERHIAYIAATRSKRELVFQDAIPPILGGK